MRLQGSVAALLCILLIVSASTAYSKDEWFSFSQPAAGNVLVTLSGDIPWCYARLGGFLGEPVLGLNSTLVEITSEVYAGECSPTPPGYPIPPPVPYSFTVDLGVLPDGRYRVIWSFVGALLPTSTYKSAFIVAEGQVSIFLDAFE